MAHSQSAIKSFRRCQKQYSFRRDYAPEGLELVRRAPSLPLRRGSWLHILSHVNRSNWAGIPAKVEVGRRYVKGVARPKIIEVETWEEAHDALVAGYNQLFDEEKEEYGDLPGEAERLWRSYLHFWRDDADKYSIARVNVGGREIPAIELALEVPLGKWGIDDSFKGRIDTLVEDSEYGGLWIWDEKWVKSLPAPDERMMNPQSLLYTWACKKQLGLDIRGFAFNYGRTKPPAIPQVLQKGVLTTKRSLDSDYVTYLLAIKRLHGDDWRRWATKVYATKLKELKARESMWFRRDRVPVEPARVKRALAEYITTVRDIERRALEDVPRTYDYRCKFNCDYHGLCVSEFTGLDIQPLIRDRYEVVPERYSEEETFAE